MLNLIQYRKSLLWCLAIPNFCCCISLMVTISFKNYRSRMRQHGAAAVWYQTLFWSIFNSSYNVSHRNCHCCSKIYLMFHRISWLYKYSLSTLIFVGLISMCLIIVHTPCILDWQSTSLKQNLRNYRKSSCWIKEKRYKPTVNTWWMEEPVGQDRCE